MKYKVYSGTSKYSIYNGDNHYTLNMFKSEKYPKHREEIEAYIDNMNEPTLIDNGNGSVTLTFDPISQEMATWMVQSKTIFFNIVRQNIGNRNSRIHSRGTKKASKHSIEDYFPYSWDYKGPIDMTIPNTLNDKSNRLLLISELTSGRITRNISHIYDYNYSNSWGVRACEEDFIFEFYIGLIYWDANNCPTLYKMSKFNVSSQDMNHYS